MSEQYYPSNPPTEAQFRFVRGLFWRYCQIKLTDKFNPSSWEQKRDFYWRSFLTNHPEFVDGSRIGLNPIECLTKTNVSKIISHLKPVIEANPDFVYHARQSSFKPQFSREYFNNLKLS